MEGQCQGLFHQLELFTRLSELRLVAPERWLSLAPSLSEVDQILRGMALTLKPEGILAGIFPAMESAMESAL